MQPMHQARKYHSSCQLAGFIYVFCGIGGGNTVEKLAIDSNSSQQSKIKWQLIPHKNLVGLPKLDRHFSIGLNSEEILIFGGGRYSKQRVQVYDTRTD